MKTKQKKFEITGIVEQEVTEVIRSKSLSRAVRRFINNHNCMPEVVNGKDVLYICESCSEPIFSGQKYGYGGEGVYLHDKCAKGL